MTDYGLRSTRNSWAFIFVCHVLKTDSVIKADTKLFQKVFPFSFESEYLFDLGQ